VARAFAVKDEAECVAKARIYVQRLHTVLPPELGIPNFCHHPDDFGTEFDEATSPQHFSAYLMFADRLH
jgi:hypothetical protein